MDYNKYGGRILRDGTLEMRDPNDNARHRYQYRRINGVPMRRVLPDTGDYDPPARWELFQADLLPDNNPIRHYFQN